MSRPPFERALGLPTDAQLEQATQWFLRVRSESAQVENLPELKAWIDNDPLNRLAYQQVAATWSAVGQFSSAPEVMAGRRDALDDAQRAARRRRSAQRRLPRYTTLAASMIVAVVGATAWLYSQRGLYTTDLGERRILTLEDGSVVTLDARSRLRVRYGSDQRTLSLERGQARFDVTKDPARPFRVRAAGQTVIALGTQFNVELVAGNVLVSTIEGQVAVTGVNSNGAQPIQAEQLSAKERNGAAPSIGRGETKVRAAEKQSVAVAHPGIIELTAGEGLRIRSNGEAVVVPKIDVDRATAWQSGKMFFDNEPLASAAERINRYAQVKIVVDPSVAEVGINGVFNAGDSDAFIDAISSYFGIQVNRTGDTFRLTARP